MRGWEKERMKEREHTPAIERTKESDKGVNSYLLCSSQSQQCSTAIIKSYSSKAAWSSFGTYSSLVLELSSCGEKGASKGSLNPTRGSFKKRNRFEMSAATNAVFFGGTLYIIFWVGADSSVTGDQGDLHTIPSVNFREFVFLSGESRR